MTFRLTSGISINLKLPTAFAISLSVTQDGGLARLKGRRARNRPEHAIPCTELMLHRIRDVALRMVVLS